MKHFFTADLHFNHANIIKYCNRPFVTVEEMNTILVSNWNATVPHEDIEPSIVYVLGDFCFSKKGLSSKHFLDQLNGSEINLILGNHDDYDDVKNAGFSNIDKMAEVFINHTRIVMLHYAMKIWNAAHWGAWNLYGHSHGTLLDDPHALSMDVGVDANGYKPISFEEIKTKMSMKEFKPIDHHK